MPSHTRSLQVDLPNKLADEVAAMVEAGWFSSESEVVTLALLEFARRQRFALQEQFQLEDVDWALRQRSDKP